MAMTPEERAEHECKVDAHLAKLRAFLLEPNHGNADWPTIPREESQAAIDLMSEMADLKWARDCDNDSPVRIMMFQRRIHRLVWEYPIRHINSNESDSAVERGLLNNLSTVSSAISSYSSELTLIQRHLDEIARAKAARAAAYPVYVARYKASDAWKATVASAFDKPVSLHASEEAAKGFVPPAELNLELISVKAEWAVPDTYADVTNNYEAYRAKVTAESEKVVSQFGVLNKLNIQARKPTDRD